MTTQTEQAIKPCPFCGHVGLDFREGSTFRWLAAAMQGKMSDEQYKAWLSAPY